MQKSCFFRMNGVLVLLLILISSFARAQTPGYLILIDAENKQAFTVRIGDQLYASSGHGHLVLSHLGDSNYRLNIRFPKQRIPEQVFPVKVHQKDLGFQLKGADSSWVLYNWQTKETIHTLKEIDSSRLLEQGVKREDGFSRLMAAVVNDSSVMYNTYTGMGFDQNTAMGKIQKTDSMGLAKTADAAIKKAPEATLLKPADSIARKPGAIALAKMEKKRIRDSLAAVKPLPPAVVFNPGIKKLREISLKISRKMVFIDIGKNGLADTVTLFVYFETRDMTAKKPSVVLVTPIIAPSATPVSPSAAGASDRLPVSGDTMRTMAHPAAVKTPFACNQFATDADLESLRTAILEANSEQEKIAVASGAFALKCFSAAQIRLLAGLFVSEKARYRLLDAAHLHISDHSSFHELGDMFTDKSILKKFALLAEKRS